MKNIDFKFRRKPVLIAVAAIAILAGLLIVVFSTGSGAADSKKKSAPRPALTVTTVRPSQASLPIKLSANGSITAWQEAIIGSEVNGLRLTEVRANVGDRVRAGQVLAVFGLESVQAEVAQSRASLAEAEASAVDATGNAEKARTLQASGALSEQQINQYMTAEKTAKARLDAARAALTVQQVKLKQTQLLAPDNGVISARAATVGAVVGAGTELFRMIRGGRLEWRAEVTSSELGRLPIGTAATVVAANGVELKGKVRMIAPTVDPQTRSALVYVDLPSNTGKLTSAPGKAGEAANITPITAPVTAGMFAKGEFELGTSNAITVPQQSVVIRDGFSYVFVLGADSHVSQVKVQTGRRLGDTVEVNSGLKPESELVVSGAGFLNDGDLVSKVSAESQKSPATK
ncbi:MAG: efflux RND transporter periplasmic adaptor subunit [Pseudomonadota bacterium]